MTETFLRSMIINGDDEEQEEFTIIGTDRDHSSAFQTIRDTDPDLYQLFRNGLESLAMPDTAVIDERRSMDRAQITTRLMEARKSLKDIKQALYGEAARLLTSSLERLILKVFTPATLMQCAPADNAVYVMGPALGLAEVTAVKALSESLSGSVLLGMSEDNELRCVIDGEADCELSVHAALMQTAQAANQIPQAALQSSKCVVLSGLRAWQRKIVHAAAKVYGLKTASFDVAVPLADPLFKPLLTSGQKNPSVRLMALYEADKPTAPPLALCTILLPIRGRQRDAPPSGGVNVRSASSRSRSRSAPKQLRILTDENNQEKVDAEHVIRVAGAAVAHANALARKEERARKREERAKLATTEA